LSENNQRLGRVQNGAGLLGVTRKLTSFVVPLVTRHVIPYLKNAAIHVATNVLTNGMRIKEAARMQKNQLVNDLKKEAVSAVVNKFAQSGRGLKQSRNLKVLHPLKLDQKQKKRKCAKSNSCHKRTKLDFLS